MDYYLYSDSQFIEARPNAYAGIWRAVRLFSDWQGRREFRVCYNGSRSVEQWSTLVEEVHPGRDEVRLTGGAWVKVRALEEVR